MKKRYWSKYEIYDVRTGKTVVEGVGTLKMTGLDKSEAEQNLGQIFLWRWKDCESPEEEEMLSKYGIPYDIRKAGSTYCKAVSKSTLKHWEELDNWYELHPSKWAKTGWKNY